MRKGIIVGTLLIVFVTIMLPITSLAESNSATERIEKQQIFLKEIQENISPKAWEPTCILRLLLWLRNVVLFGGILIIIKIVKNLFNTSSLSTLS